MASIIVKRFDGSKEGSPVVEILAASESALLARGRIELDDKSTDKKQIKIDIPYEEDIQLLQLVKLFYFDDNKEYIGKVTGVSHSFTLPEAITSLTLEAVL